MQIKNQFPLSEITSFHLGGPAAYFCSVTSEAEIREALAFAKEKNLPVLILGGGSNVLISDQGFEGLVIQNKIAGLVIEDSGVVNIGAGESWDDVVAQTVQHGLSGVECLSGVPGSAGGAVVQNIGAYGQTLGDRLVEATAIEVATGTEKKFTKAAGEFSYRSSWFKRNPNQYIVTRFQIKLIPNGEPNVSYPHVQKHFDKHPRPTLAELREFIIRLRASKGYLILPGYDSYNTAGSFFKNPIVTKAQFEPLQSVFGNLELNRFWLTENGVKLAAAYLMQEAGFGKGYREGNVGVSPKHSLSLINFGGGMAMEVKNLADKIKRVVREKFGVNLEEEVLYIGKFD